MMALDAKTGALVTGLGADGSRPEASMRGDVDGQFISISPPVVYRDIVITGGATARARRAPGSTAISEDGTRAPAGCCGVSHRAARRASLESRPGRATLEEPSGTNAWSYMTVDVERGLVFAPIGSPTSDFYGADCRAVTSTATASSLSTPRPAAEVVPAARAPRHLGLGFARPRRR